MRRIVVAAAALAALVGAAPAQAQAQMQVTECEGPGLRGAQCATVPVPLEHGNLARGTIDLAFVRVPARAERRGTIVFLAGGPGQAATPLAASVAAGPLRSLRRRYDLVFVDQRGTGRSSPLRCTDAPQGAFRIDEDATPAQVAEVVARCAAEIGEARNFFTTNQTVLDLDVLRAALGVEQIIPLGVSYGGQVAGDYARRFPERTQSLILDSTSPIEGADMLGALPQLALPRVLREVCFPPGCDRVLGSPEELLAAAVERIGEDGLRGRVVTPQGRKRTARITVSTLYALVRASDVDPGLRTALPAALEAASRGDAAPLLRLAASGTGGGAPDDEATNEIRLLATNCLEGRLPWHPTSDPATRPALLEQAVAEDADRYAPFPVSTVLPQLGATLCLGWPAAPEPPGAASPGPDVPVLVLAGREDLRTPLEDQRRAAGQYPNARVVAVPNVGHSVLGTDLSGCARDAVTAFLFARRRAECPHTRAVPLALPVFPSLADLPGAAGDAPRRVERTVVAVDLTLRDVDRQLSALAIGGSATATNAERRVIRLGGLRGGRLEVRRSGVRLRAYEVVPGVRVTGRLGENGVGALVVSGRGAEGALRVTRSGRLVGTLDGTRIRYRPLPVGGGA